MPDEPPLPQRRLVDHPRPRPHRLARPLELLIQRRIVRHLDQPAHLTQPVKKRRLVGPALILHELHLLVVRRLLERRLEMDEIERGAVGAAEVVDDVGRGGEERPFVFQHSWVREKSR